MNCPVCGGTMWDNRQNKKNPMAPDYKCKEDKGPCKWKYNKNTKKYDIPSDYPTGVWDRSSATDRFANDLKGDIIQENIERRDQNIKEAQEKRAEEVEKQLAAMDYLTKSISSLNESIKGLNDTMSKKAEDDIRNLPI